MNQTAQELEIFGEVNPRPHLSAAEGFGAMLDTIQNHTDGFPKSVAGELWVPSSHGGYLGVDTANRLAAWLHTRFELKWRTQDAMTPSVFFEYALSNCQKFGAVAFHPHYPMLKDVLYLHDEPDENDGKYLEQFLDFFEHASVVDRELHKAMLLTLFWGGPPGTRPLFVITSDGVANGSGSGAGKSTLATQAGELCGGCMTLGSTETIETLKKRMFSKAQKNTGSVPRLVLLDNVRGTRYGDPDLESLLTSPVVSGHKMFSGDAAAPNYYTYVMTINGAAFVKDTASRCVAIKVKPAKHSQQWDLNLNEFLEKHRPRIIGGIKGLLKSTGVTLADEGTGRWAAWERGVLSRVKDPGAVRNEIRSRLRELDDDANESQELLSVLLEHPKAFAQIAPKELLVFSQDEILECLNTVRGRQHQVSSKALSKWFDQHRPQWLYRLATLGKPRRWFVNRSGDPVTDECIQNWKNGGIQKPSSSGIAKNPQNLGTKPKKKKKKKKMSA